MDDLVIAANDIHTINTVKEMLSTKFKMKDLGKLKHFLGIDFTQEKGEIRMSQKKFITKIVESLV